MKTSQSLIEIPPREKTYELPSVYPSLSAMLLLLVALHVVASSCVSTLIASLLVLLYIFCFCISWMVGPVMAIQVFWLGYCLGTELACNRF